MSFNTLKHVFTSENQRFPSAFTSQIPKISGLRPAAKGVPFVSMFFMNLPPPLVSKYPKTRGGGQIHKGGGTQRNTPDPGIENFRKNIFSNFKMFFSSKMFDL